PWSSCLTGTTGAAPPRRPDRPLVPARWTAPAGPPLSGHPGAAALPPPRAQRAHPVAELREVLGRLEAAQEVDQPGGRRGPLRLLDLEHVVRAARRRRAERLRRERTVHQVEVARRGVEPELLVEGDPQPAVGAENPPPVAAHQHRLEVV